MLKGSMTFQLSLSRSNSVLTAIEAEEGVTFGLLNGEYSLYEVSFLETGATETFLKSFATFLDAFHTAKKLYLRTYGDMPIIRINCSSSSYRPTEDIVPRFLVIFSQNMFKSYSMGRFAIWETE